jgi:hypothetical protein
MPRFLLKYQRIHRMIKNRKSQGGLFNGFRVNGITVNGIRAVEA